LLLLLVLPALLAVSCQEDKAPSRWTRIFGEKGEDESVISVLTASDGGFLLLGTSCHYSDTEHGDVCRTYLLKTDEKGNEMWNKSINEYQRGRTTLSAFETGDKGYIVFTASMVDKRYYVFIIKTDKDANKLWSKTIETYIKSHPLAIRESDGNFIITGATSTEDVIEVIEVDKEGNILVRRTIDVPLDGPTLSDFIVISTSDGGFIITGTRYEEEDKSDIYLIKVDENGNTLWSRPLGDVNRAERSGHILETSEGGIVIAGSVSPSIEPRTDSNIYIACLKADGTRLWEKTYGSDSNVEVANSVVLTEDGGFVIAGERRDPLLGVTYLLRIDKRGNDMWSRTFESHDNWSIASSVLQTPDGGFIVAGGVSRHLPDRMENDIFLMKMDSEGNYDPLR
jgi:hypothetical protein